MNGSDSLIVQREMEPKTLCQDHGREIPCDVCRLLNEPSKLVSLVTVATGDLLALDDEGCLWRERATGWEPMLHLWNEEQRQVRASRGRRILGTEWRPIPGSGRNEP